MPYVFGDYVLHAQRRELSHRGRAVPLRPQVFDLLVYLVTHSDRVVSKQELHANLWPNVHVSPATLSAAIKRARQAVGDSGAGQHVIHTLHGRGYRFVAPMEERAAPSPTARPATVPALGMDMPASRSPGMPSTPAPDGAALAGPGEAGELKPVSVLCGALADGPALAATLGPEGLYRRLHMVRQATRAVMKQYAGTLIPQAIGEGFTAVFGAPVAQEDHSRRAVLAALDLLERLRQSPGEPAPVLSMGIHSSVVVVGDPGPDPSELMTVVGPASQGALRLQQRAAPGALLVSAPAYHAVQDDVGGEVCGSLALDVGREPMAVYAVQAPVRRHTGVLELSRRPRSPFVGRQRELALLHDRLTVVRSGDGQVVSLMGAPGIGKTRLLMEFGRSVTTDEVTWYGVQCVAYGQVAPYWTAREFLRQACAVVEGEPASVRAEAVRHRLTALEGVAETDVALMLQILDLPSSPDLLAQLGPEVRHARTFALLWQVIRHEAERRPLVLAVDNVHWIDATSAAWLAFLVERLASTAVLLLVTARPGTPAPWGTHAAVTQLVLPPLRPAESETLVQHASDGASLSAALNEQIVTRGAGNPFFLEELARHAVEHGGAATLVRVPETVHAVLAARIDRLAPAAKHLLQAAAVLGMQVTEPLLRAVTTPADVEIHASLQELQAAEFLHETRAVPVRTYTFKHALTQEVAYHSLLTHTRQQHHQRIARVVAEQFPDLAAAQPELVAQHYTAAGLSAEALPYWQRAGQLALQRSANREAVAHLTTALGILAARPDSPARADQELDLQLTLGPVLMAIKGQAAPEVEQTYARAWALCQGVPDTRRRFQALWGLQRWYRGQGAFSRAQELGKELVRLAERDADQGRRLEARDALGTTLFFLGDYTGARRHLERGSAFTDPAVQRDFMLRRGEAPGVRALAFLAWTLWCLGYPAQAAGRSQEGLALAQELAHPYSLAGAQLWAADLHLRRREAAEAQALAEALVTLATAQGYPVFLAMGMCYRGSALAMQGQDSAGLALLRQGMTAVAGTGHVQSRPRCLMLLAEAAGRAGQVEEALRLLGEAREALEANGQGDLLAEAHRLQGTLLLHDAVRDEVRAAACFQRALAIARRQRARSWELRGAVGLARLRQQQGKHREARDLLDPIRGWFTEGLDTADLLEAQALLPARVPGRRPS